MTLFRKLTDGVADRIKEACATSNSMAEAGAKIPELNHNTFIRYAKHLGVYRTNQSGKGISKRAPNRTLPLQEILAGTHPQYGSNKLRKRLLAEGIFEARCARCQGASWLGKPMPLELEHKDGNPTNHCLSNLELLCPNCHTLTPTYKSKNRKQV